MADSAGKASVQNVVFSFALMALSILINVSIARLLGPDAKGVLSVFQTTQSIILVVGYSVQQAVVRVVAQQRPDWLLLRRGLALLAFLLAVFLVGLLALAVQFPLGRRIFFPGLPLGYLWVLFFSVWGALWFFFRSAVVDGLQQYSLAVRVGFLTNIISNSVMLSAVVVLTTLHMMTAPAVILTNVTAIVGTGMLVWWLVTRKIAIQDGVRLPIRAVLRLIVKDSIPIYIRDLLEWANSRVDVFFVNGFLGQGQVGLYSVAVGLATQTLLVPMSIMGPLYSRVAREGEGEANLSVVQYAFRVTLALSVALALAMLVVVPFLLPLVYGNRFAPSVPLLMLLLPGTILVAPTKVAITYLRACGELALPIRAEIIGLILTVALDSTLIPRFGPMGAAVANSCSYGGLSVFLCYQFMRRSNSLPSDLLLLRGADVRRVLNSVMQLLPKRKQAA